MGTEPTSTVRYEPQYAAALGVLERSTRAEIGERVADITRVTTRSHEIRPATAVLLSLIADYVHELTWNDRPISLRDRVAAVTKDVRVPHDYADVVACCLDLGLGRQPVSGADLMEVVKGLAGPLGERIALVTERLIRHVAEDGVVTLLDARRS